MIKITLGQVLAVLREPFGWKLAGYKGGDIRDEHGCCPVEAAAGHKVDAVSRGDVVWEDGLVFAADDVADHEPPRTYRKQMLEAAGLRP